MVSLGSSFSSTTNEIQFYMAFEGVPTTDTSHMTSMDASTLGSVD